MVGAEAVVFKWNDAQLSGEGGFLPMPRGLQHLLDGANEIAIDADHLAIRRQRQGLALLR
jgi:hypothetical protein